MRFARPHPRDSPGRTLQHALGGLHLFPTDSWLPRWSWEGLHFGQQEQLTKRSTENLPGSARMRFSVLGRMLAHMVQVPATGRAPPSPTVRHPHFCSEFACFFGLTEQGMS